MLYVINLWENVILNFELKTTSKDDLLLSLEFQETKLKQNH